MRSQGHLVRWALAAIVGVAITLLLVPVTQAQSAPSAVSPDTRQLETARHPSYRIGLNDVLQLDFPFTPDYNQTLTVHPDGFISLKDIGDLYIAGMTTAEAAEAIRTACGKIMLQPVLTLDLKDYEKPYFVVSGKVAKPGKYDLRGETTVLQAIAVAGGFDDAAKHSEVLLLRRTPGDWVEVKTLNAKAMLAKRDLREDIALRDGDMIIVPKSMIAKLRPWIPTSSLGLFLNQF